MAGIASARGKIGRTIQRAILYIFTIGLCTVFSVPFVWALGSSFKNAREILSYPPSLLPESLLWTNYVRVFQVAPYARWFLNTMLVCTLTVAGILISASIVAYGFARFRWPGRDAAFVICLSTMMLPAQVTIVPVYLGFRALGWLDTLKPLFVPAFFGGGAFNIFLLRQFFMTIPIDMDEAARIDGAGIVRVFFQVLMPLSKPVLATVAVLSFIGSWNDFMGPLIFLDSEENFTLALGLRRFSMAGSELVTAGEGRQQFMMAAALMASAPTIILFLSAQRFYIHSIVTSGIKG